MFTFRLRQITFQLYYLNLKAFKCSKVESISNKPVPDVLSLLAEDGRRTDHLDVQVVNTNFHILEKYKFDRRTAPTKFYQLNSNHLKNMVEILEESGAKVNTQNLVHIKALQREHISTLKQENKLDAKIDVLEHSLSYMPPFPFDRNVPVISLTVKYDLPKAKRFTRAAMVHIKEENKSYVNDEFEKVDLRVNETPYDQIDSVRFAIMRQYLSWRWEVDLRVIDLILLKNIKSVIFKSLRGLVSTLDFIDNSLKIPKAKILNNLYLLSNDPNQMEKLLSNVKILCGVDIVQAINKFPKISTKSDEELLEIWKVFKDNGIPDAFVAKHLDIFTLLPSTIEDRIKKVRSSPDYSVFLCHPRIVSLLFYLNKADERRKKLKENNIKCYSLDCFLSSKVSFERLIADGTDKASMSDFIILIKHYLHVEADVIYDALSRHSLRFYVSIQEVDESLKYLLTQNFSFQAIVESLQIVLYPKSFIETTLKQVMADESLSQYGFEGGILREETHFFEKGTRSRDKRLALCLYYVEKDFHFTGEGIWRTQK